MPQMSPLNWLFLYMIFIILFLITMILTYFLYQPLKENKNMIFSSKKKSMIWKW